jgi:hypothetical protein
MKGNICFNAGDIMAAIDDASSVCAGLVFATAVFILVAQQGFQTQ